MFVFGYVALLVPSTALAEECEWWQDLIGICSAGEQIREGIEEGAERAGDAVFSTFNYWTKLIEDYHTGTAEEQKKARQIVTRVFGAADLTATPNPFQVRVEVSGVDTTKHPLRVAILTDYEQTAGTVREVIYKGVRSDFNFVQLRQVPGAPADLGAYKRSLSAIRAEVAAAASAVGKHAVELDLGNQRANFLPKCASVHDGGFVVNQACRDTSQKLLSENLVKAIMALADERIELRSNRLSVSAPWSGQPYVTIVVPEEDVKNHPKLAMIYTIHVTGKVDHALPPFVGNPGEISVERMRESPPFESEVPDHGGSYQIAPVVIHY